MKKEDVKDSLINTIPSASGAFLGALIDPVYGSVVGGALGGFISQYFSNRQQEVIKRRIKKLESKVEMLEEFTAQIHDMDDDDFLRYRDLLQMYLISAGTEAADLSINSLIEYVEKNNNRNVTGIIADCILRMSASDLKELRWMKRKIEEEYKGDFDSVYDWDKISRHRTTNQDGKDIGMPVESLGKARSENGKAAAYLTYQAYRKFSDLGLIVTQHMNYTGYNEAFSIDKFSLTEIGVRVMREIGKPDQNS